MANTVEIKLAEISEPFISIQNEDATLFDYLLEIEPEEFENYKRIQSEFIKMQKKLQELIGSVNILIQ